MTIPALDKPECLWLMRTIDAAVDGELSPDDQRRFDRHLTACTHCAAEYARATTLRQILALGDNSVVLEEPLEESTALVMTRIRQTENSDRHLAKTDNRRIWVIGTLSLAASLLVFSILTWYSARMMRLPESAPRAGRTSAIESPMLVAASASDESDEMNQLTSEEEALFAAGLMTLATPGVMSRIEAVARAQAGTIRTATDSLDGRSYDTTSDTTQTSSPTR